MSKAAVFFDLDGVLADWVPAFESASGMNIDEFNALDESTRDSIKERVYSYEFFRELKPIADGMMLFRNWKLIHGNNVFINSASGEIKPDIVAKAKRDWCKEYLDIAPENVYIVERTEDKPHVVILDDRFNSYDEYILLDDRQKAIDAWEIHGRSFTGMLVKAS